MIKRSFIVIIFIMTIFLGGCTTNNTVYDEYVKDLSNTKTTSNDLPFDINIDIEKLTDNDIIYHVIIDHSAYLLYNVKAIVIHNQESDDIFPSIGIVDEPINLSPTTKEGFSKGIILTGYLPYQKYPNLEFKVLIKYTIDNEELTKYYVTNMTYSNN